MRLFLFIVILIVGALANADVGKTDSELSKEIVGVWSATYNRDNYSLYGESYYLKNGIKQSHGEVCIHGKCRTIAIESTYEIKNGAIIATVISSNSDANPVGDVQIDIIKSINEETLVLINEYGAEQIRIKVLSPKFILNLK